MQAKCKVRVDYSGGFICNHSRGLFPYIWLWLLCCCPEIILKWKQGYLVMLLLRNYYGYLVTLPFRNYYAAVPRRRIFILQHTALEGHE